MAVPRRRISDEALKKATRKDRAAWFKLLDKAGAEKLTHKEIAAWLSKKYVASSWWAQMITVEYEKARGKRVTGKTKDAGFEIGVQKTLAIPAKQAWDLLVDVNTRKLWLGTVDHLPLARGTTFKTKEGAVGEIRSITLGRHIRFTWQPKDWEHSSTIQIYVLPKGDKSALHFHQEKLTSKKQRETQRQHWQQVATAIEKLLD